jgi:hypothetical protein
LFLFIHFVDPFKEGGGRVQVLAKSMWMEVSVKLDVPLDWMSRLSNSSTMRVYCQADHWE